MSDDQEYTDERIEEPVALTEQDVRDLNLLGSEPDSESIVINEPQEYRPLLVIWTAALAPSADAALEKSTPRYAVRLLGEYMDLHFADVPVVQALYFEKVEVLKNILAGVVEDTRRVRPEALTTTTFEEDLEENEHRYTELLLQWQLQFLQWELEWDATAPDAAAQLASAGEAYKMIFTERGLTAHLDNIGYVYSEADQVSAEEAMAEIRDAAVAAHKAEVTGE